MEVGVRLLELVRGRAIDHPASELGQSEELLRVWREAFPLVEQGRLRIGVAFEEVNRLLVVPDVALKLQRAGSFSVAATSFRTSGLNLSI